MGMPIHVCTTLSLQMEKRSAIGKNQRRILSGHAVWGLDEPAVRPDLSSKTLKMNLPSWGFEIPDRCPGVRFSARTRPTPLFALQDICREGTKGWGTDKHATIEANTKICQMTA